MVQESTFHAKWIVCETDRPEMFSESQKRWSKLSSLPGFIFQVGGWHSRRTACILSLWRSQADYARFMTESHDPIYLSSGQRQTYEQSYVKSGKVQVMIPGSSPTLYSASKNGLLMRCALCQLAHGGEREFWQAQKQVWNPGMLSQLGMLGGCVCRLDQNEYLVATLWSSERAHQLYRLKSLPKLQEQSKSLSHIENISGYVIPLLDDWRLVGEGTALE